MKRREFMKKAGLAMCGIGLLGKSLTNARERCYKAMHGDVFEVISFPNSSYKMSINRTLPLRLDIEGLYLMAGCKAKVKMRMC